MKAPRIIPVDGQAPLPSSVIEECRTVLAAGALIVVPTETVYGVAVDACNPEAEKRLFQIKNRPDGKPIALLVHDCEQIVRWGGKFGRLEMQLAERFWPGPLTMVLPVEPSAGSFMVRPDSASQAHARNAGFEGFRVPDHPVVLTLLKALDFPLRATSANLAGEPPARTAESAVRMLGDSVDLVLDGGPVRDGIPSTVIKSEGGTFRLLREGAIPGAHIERTAVRSGNQGK